MERPNSDSEIETLKAPLFFNHTILIVSEPSWKRGVIVLHAPQTNGGEVRERAFDFTFRRREVGTVLRTWSFKIAACCLAFSIV